MLSTVILALLDGRRRNLDVRRLFAVGGRPAKHVASSAAQARPEAPRPRAGALALQAACPITSSASGTAWRQAILDAEGRASGEPSARPTIRRIASDPAALQERYAALEAARAEVDRLYASWAELEAEQA